MRKVLLFAVVLLMFGCDEGGGSSKAQGTEGGACYPNGTCNDGLECVDDVCSSGHVNNTNNTNNVNNVNNANPGELGGACLEGDLCNEGLVCSEAICKTDADGDGYPSDNDCDDNDENAYPGAILECQSDCAYGTKACNSAGEWTECTADTECTCTTPGETKDVPCGKCGTASVMCTADLVWEFPTNCQNEGECHPWEDGQQECGFCGHQERACDSTCHWEDWSECANPGECTPGVTEWTTDDCSPLGNIRERSCNSSCAWEDGQGCTDQCQIQPVTGTSDFRDEVCITAGPFNMGATPDIALHAEESPMHVVYLSPYLIDIYPVTNEAYAACVSDGVCTLPTSNYAEYSDPTYKDYAVHFVTRDQAITYCNWDGGKSIPTEAQWEKAGKGPYPSTILNPWGNADADCNFCSGETCNGVEAVDAHPAGVSPYGLYDMVGNYKQWVSDFNDLDYYQNSPSVDPEGPLSGDYYSIRGWQFFSIFYSGISTLTYRSYAEIISYTPEYETIRCARYAYPRSAQ